MPYLSTEHSDYILELWNVSKIPVGNGRYERLLYVRDEFLIKYPEFKTKPKTIWLFIVDITGVFQFKSEIKKEMEKTGEWCKVKIEWDGEVTGMKSSENWRYNPKTNTGGRRFLGNIYDKAFQDYWDLTEVRLISDISENQMS